MAVILKDIIKIIEDIAPINLAENYDNCGLMVGDPEEEIEGVLVALDVTDEIIEEAIANKCNLILTHHPMFFIRPDSITPKDLIGKKVIKLVKNNINVYAAHTNLDKVKAGLNDKLMDLLGFTGYEILDTDPECAEGIGRISDIEEIELSALLKLINERLKPNCIRYTGDLNQKITKVAVVNGAGSEYIKLAYNKGAQCLITGDTKYHEMFDAKELGLCVIDAGHFSTEWTIFKMAMDKVYEEVERNYGSISYHESQKSKDVYEIFSIK